LMMKTMMNGEEHQHGGAMDQGHDHHALPHDLPQVSKPGKASD
jgi:hypothetical protein